MHEAKNLGFDSVRPAEHPFSEYGYCASPQVSLAAVAARTKRIRLGTGDVEHAVEKLTHVTREYGFDELLCWTRIGGLENPKVLRSMELMSGRVLPRVRGELATAA